MYVRLRSIPLRCNNVRWRGKLSVIPQHLLFCFVSFVDVQAAIDMSAHLQLTPRDSDLLPPHACRAAFALRQSDYQRIRKEDLHT